MEQLLASVNFPLVSLLELQSAEQGQEQNFALFCCRMDGSLFLVKLISDFPVDTELLRVRSSAAIDVHLAQCVGVCGGAFCTVPMWGSYAGALTQVLEQPEGYSKIH